MILFPDIVPFSLSLWDVASSSASQQLVLIGAAFVTPVVLGYSAFTYWVFRGRTPAKGWGRMKNWLRQILWFLAIYLASVASFALLVLLTRMLLRGAF